MHSKIIERMNQSLEEAPAAEERRELQAHLAECDECASEWEALLSAHRLFAETAAAVPAAGFNERVLQRIGEQELAQKGYGSTAWAAGAIAMVALGLLALVWLPLDLVADARGWTALVGGVIGALALISTVVDVIQALGGAVVEGIGEWPLLGMAVFTLGLCIVWVRLVMGPAQSLLANRIAEE